MAKKASRKIVALSSAAILAVYGAGYLRTQSVADQLAQTVALTSGLSDPVQAASYRDGTYSGTGKSSFGDVFVTLTLRGHHIVDVTITADTTSYSEKWIDGLPGQVKARQSARVDVVSGATFSTAAFQQAVLNALVLARA